MAMIAMTTKSSINVKPRRRCETIFRMRLAILSARAKPQKFQVNRQGCVTKTGAVSRQPCLLYRRLPVGAGGGDMRRRDCKEYLLPRPPPRRFGNLRNGRLGSLRYGDECAAGIRIALTPRLRVRRM